jgi:hypothetical protein
VNGLLSGAACSMQPGLSGKTCMRKNACEYDFDVVWRHFGCPRKERSGTFFSYPEPTGLTIQSKDDSGLRNLD